MFKKISLSVASNIISQGIGFIMFVLTAKYYGPEGRGLFSAGISMTTLMATLAGFSIGRVLLHEILHTCKTPVFFFRARFFTLISVFGLTCLLGYLITFFVWLFRPDLFGNLPPTLIFLCFLSLPYFLWTSYSPYVFAALGKVLSQNKITIVNRIVFISSFALLLFFFRLSLIGFLVIYAFFNLVQITTEMIFILRHSKAIPSWNIAFAKRIVIKGFNMHFDTIGAVLYTSLSMILLNYYLQPADVGIYNFAAQLIGIMIIIPNVVAQYINSEIAKSGPDNILALQRKYIRNTLAFLLVAAAIAYFAITPFVNIINKKFADAIPLFQLLLFTVLPNAFAILMSPQWLGRGYFRTTSAITIGLGVIAILVVYFTIGKWRIYSAAASTITIYTLAFFINLGFYLKIMKNK